MFPIQPVPNLRPGGPSPIWQETDCANHKVKADPAPTLEFSRTRRMQPRQSPTAKVVHPDYVLESVAASCSDVHHVVL